MACARLLRGALGLGKPKRGPNAGEIPHRHRPKLRSAPCADLRMRHVHLGRTLPRSPGIFRARFRCVAERGEKGALDFEKLASAGNRGALR